MVLHPVSGVADDFGVLPVLPVAVLVLLSAAEVPLVTGQSDVGPQQPDGPGCQRCLVGESDLVVGRELVGLQSSSGSVKIVNLEDTSGLPETDGELVQIVQGGVQHLRLGGSWWKFNGGICLQHSDGHAQAPLQDY